MMHSNSDTLLEAGSQSGSSEALTVSTALTLALKPGTLPPSRSPRMWEGGEKGRPGKGEWNRAVRDYNPVQFGGTQALQPPTISVIPNGCRSATKGVTVVVSEAKFRTYAMLLQTLTKHLHQTTRRLCTPAGKVVHHLAELEDRGVYIACDTGEAVKPLPSDIDAVLKKAERRRDASPSGRILSSPRSPRSPRASSPHPPVSPRFAQLSERQRSFSLDAVVPGSGLGDARPRANSSGASLQPRSPRDPPEMVRSPSGRLSPRFVKKPPSILVFRNNDKFDEGRNILVQPSQPLQKQMESMSAVIKLPTGAVRKLYTIEGKRVTSVEELVDGQCYIACGGEAFKAPASPRSALKVRK